MRTAENAPAGQRDLTLYRMASTATKAARAGAFDPHEAYDRLLDAGLRLGQPQHEIRRALRQLERECRR